MFDLAHPWWHFLLRAAIVYVVLMVLLRLCGKRTVGEFTPFDLLVVILLGESAQGALVGDDHSVTGSVLVFTTLALLNYAVAFASARSKKIDALVEGEPVVLIRNGRLHEAALRRNNVPISDLEEALRKAGVRHRQDVELAMLETDGEITILPRAVRRADN
jgi:uncharacterized membrane protein YcaP (DUF421 family)